jgi:ABC-type Co2+ transport system permease subunit
MTMATKSKKVRVGLCALSGGLVTSAFAAFFCWIVLYTDPDTGGFLGTPQDWAPIAAIVGAVCGFIAGVVLGTILSAPRRGPAFGTLYGAIGGLGVSLFLMNKGMPDWDSRQVFFVAAMVPLGALSGLVTSLIVSAITLPTEHQKHDSYALLNLRDDKRDESW